MWFFAALGGPVAVVEPALASTTQFAYDVPNGTVTITDPNNRQTKLSYDEAYRLDRIDFLHAGEAFDYTYDLTDQLTEINYVPASLYPGGVQRFGYDFLDRLSSITEFGAASPQVTFKYDPQDRPTFIGYHFNNSGVCYEYDPDGRLEAVVRVHGSSDPSACTGGEEGVQNSVSAEGHRAMCASSRPSK